MNDHPRDLIAKAECAMDTYKYPDTGKCEEFLEQVLIAAGLVNSSPGSLGYLSIRDGSVHLRYDYSVRGCSSSDDYSFPEDILDATEPFHAAKIWGLEKRVREAGWDVAEKRRTLEYSEERLVKAEAEFAKFCEQEEVTP
jgi:hypothetical protein